MRKILVTLCLLASLWGAKAHGQAANVYVTQIGGHAGICTSNVQSLAWFNNAVNWGAGSTQIGPDTIVHVCGVFTAAFNTDYFFNFQGSGTSGHPITLLFDTGAILQSTKWGTQAGAINIAQSFITIDGGTNGIIRNTDSGTGLGIVWGTCGNGTQSRMMQITGNNVTVKNLSFLNGYVHLFSGGTGDQKGCDANAIMGRGNSNTTIGPNNTFQQFDVAIGLGWDGGEHDWIITGNHFSLCNQTIQTGPNNPGARVLTNYRIDHNDYVVGTNWDESSNSYHHNFFHIFPNGTGSQAVGTLQIYDNTLSGNMEDPASSANPNLNHSTSFIYIENNTSGAFIGQFDIFNNTIKKLDNYSNGGSGLIATQWPARIFNNTIVNPCQLGISGWSSVSLYPGASGSMVQNNIFSQGCGFEGVQGSNTATINNNVYFNWIHNTNTWSWHTTFTDVFSNWKSACACDAASVTTDPLLNPDLTIPGTSSAVNLGANLTSLGIAALNLDKNGNARPSSAAWTAGAYNATTSGPATPTNISVVVVGP